MRFYIDNKGFKRVSTSEHLRLLSSFLIEDVQNSLKWCNELLHIVQSIELGEITAWEGTGNAHTLCIFKTHVEIINEYTMESLKELDIDEFKRALIGWRDFIISHSN